MLKEEFDYLSNLTQLVMDYLVTYGFQLLGALFVLFLGWMLSAWVGRSVQRLGDSRQWDQTLVRFFANLGRIMVLGIFVVIAAGKIGITISPLIAAIGAATFGLSLALQGPVSNYGAGIALILTRPYAVGDTLELLGQAGQVDSVTLGQTVLVTEDGEHIHIPNRKVLGEIFQNSKGHKLVETTLLLPPDADPELAIAAVEALLAQRQQDDAPRAQVGIDAFTPLGVQLVVRSWLDTARYHQARLALNLSLYRCLKAAGMTPASPGGLLALSQHLNTKGDA
ncbi:mechanosensitive ion channel family protein [Gallaecimonas xiamenensis]|uniref:Small-conductance mechanosensitive channel n=1 Tax=Gallaecimonas xiamenensis 3-C-1 TaxID=745411 RepID=K2JIY0_9GAMM|nr:mechanosensitive ion channel family protein [Gallaecimonas xiamenensis]EKE75173.1 mechanosensitive ion channel protein MscS [Gallaecimonas xiamenensis 3-C-1]